MRKVGGAGKRKKEETRLSRSPQQVTPIFKSGDPTDVTNYRPISVLPILPKTAERHVHNALYSLYIEDSLRLNSQQHSRVTRYSNINFICPKFNRVTEGGRSFAVSACQLWNRLSLELRNAVSLESFKNNYRNILFKEQQELHHFIV